MKFKLDITQKKSLEILNNNTKPVETKKENENIIKNDFDLLTYN